MNLGLVVDGQAEALALKEITDRISISGQRILTPVYADMQPRATATQIAKSAKSKIDLLRARGADAVLVLIDMENNSGCPGSFAADLRSGFLKHGVQVVVVVKVRSFENWLIADPTAFAQMPARFNLSRRFERAVAPNKADMHNPKAAIELINSIANGSRYHKRKDAVAISKKLDVDVAGKNSRSFRKLLRQVNHGDYSGQSRNPASP